MQHNIHIMTDDEYSKLYCGVADCKLYASQLPEGYYKEHLLQTLEEIKELLEKED